MSFFDGGQKSSFEFSEWKLSAHGRIIRLVVVYRPTYSKEHPVPASVFFQEFSAFLETTVLCPEVLLVSGDFNFHLDDSSDADVRKFMELMDTFGLLQHITTPTHVSGHTLDLIISRSSNAITVLPSKSTCYISDHCFTECQLSISCPNMLVKEVSYRKFKQIHMDNFRSDIASSVLCNSQWTSLEELAQCYDTTFYKSWINTPP